MSDAERRLEAELDQRAQQLARHWNFRPDGREDVALRDVIKRELRAFAESAHKVWMAQP